MDAANVEKPAEAVVAAAPAARLISAGINDCPFGVNASLPDAAAAVGLKPALPVAVLLDEVFLSTEATSLLIAFIKSGSIFYY